MNERLQKSLMYVADAIDTGYSSVFTFGVKELLNNQERAELATILRNLSASQGLEFSISTRPINNRHSLKG